MYKEIKPAKSIWLQLNGLRQHLRHWPNGAGAKVLLLHGWMDVSASFQFVVDSLQTNWDIYALDWRGMGLSEHQSQGYYDRSMMLLDLKQCIDIISPDQPIHLVGHSLGGMLGSLYASLYPTRVKSLVVAEGFGIADENNSLGFNKMRRHLAGLEKCPQFSKISSYQQFASKLIKRNPALTEDKAQYLAQHLLRDDQNGGYLHCCDAKHKIPQPYPYSVDLMAQFWQKITAPLLWVQGGFVAHNDYLNSIKASLPYRRQLYGNPPVKILSGSGHMLQWEQPQQFAEVIDEFLSQITH